MNLLAAFRHQMWAIAPDSLQALSARAEAIQALIAQGMRPEAKLSPGDKAEEAYNGGNVVVPEIVGDTATLQIMGPLVGRAPWWAKAFLGVVDPYDLAKAVDALAADTNVKALVLEVDCGGGTTDGTDEAAAAMARFQAAGKTIEVRGTGLVASAAYWICAGANRFVASPTCLIGFCGTLIMLCDTTAAQAAMGIHYEVVSSAPLKGIGADGAVTPALRAQRQRWVDAITAVFRDAVAAGRGLTGAALDAAFSGDGWLAADALRMDLIDGLATPPEAQDRASSADPVPDAAPITIDSPDDCDQPAAVTTTPKAHAAEESDMKTEISAALSALSAAHPNLAKALIDEAVKPTASVEGMTAFAAAQVAKAAAEAKDAELATAKAATAAAELRAKAAEDKIAAAETRAKAAEEKAAKLEAHGTGAREVGGDAADGVTKRQIPTADASKLSVKDVEDLKAGRAVMV